MAFSTTGISKIDVTLPIDLLLIIAEVIDTGHATDIKDPGLVTPGLRLSARLLQSAGEYLVSRW